jgi:hypothetical protein
VAELEKLAKENAAMSYHIRDYEKLGLLFRLLHVEDPESRHKRRFEKYRANRSQPSQMN